MAASSGIFYADDVWKHISSHAQLNTLEMEDQLAHLSDIVIVAVEPGTFVELGAFSLSSTLRKKLLPILDVRFKHDESFINTGPLRWIDAESAFKPSIHADFSVVLHSIDEIIDRLNRIPRRRAVLDTLFLPRNAQVKDRSLTEALFAIDDSRVYKLIMEKQIVSAQLEEGLDVTVTWE